jgi:hypothetical protein
MRLEVGDRFLTLGPAHHGRCEKLPGQLSPAAPAPFFAFEPAKRLLSRLIAHLQTISILWSSSWPCSILTESRFFRPSRGAESLGHHGTVEAPGRQCCLHCPNDAAILLPRRIARYRVRPISSSTSTRRTRHDGWNDWVERVPSGTTCYARKRRPAWQGSSDDTGEGKIVCGPKQQLLLPP